MARPTERQVAWQNSEIEVLIHFGINAFTGGEWGLGTENPETFDPVDLGSDQWVHAAKAAGAKAVILATKHHSGFCLWPTKYTEFSVKHSPWKGGKGDVVGRLRKLAVRLDLSLVFIFLRRT